MGEKTVSLRSIEFTAFLAGNLGVARRVRSEVAGADIDEPDRARRSSSGGKNGHRTLSAICNRGGEGASARTPGPWPPSWRRCVPIRRSPSHGARTAGHSRSKAGAFAQGFAARRGKAPATRIAIVKFFDGNRAAARQSHGNSDLEIYDWVSLKNLPGCSLRTLDARFRPALTLCGTNIADEVRPDAVQMPSIDPPAPAE